MINGRVRILQSHQTDIFKGFSFYLFCSKWNILVHGQIKDQDLSLFLYFSFLFIDNSIDHRENWMEVKL